MKRIFTISLAVCALFATACNKDVYPEINDSGKKIAMTLTVSAPSNTRTELGDRLSINWQEGDAITVFGDNTSSNSGYTFTITDGIGKDTATFTGEIDESDASQTFYAVYPAVEVRPSSLSDDKIELNNALGTEQTAVKDGYDPNFAILTGVISDGKVTFRHGMAYFKLTVGTEGVYSIKLETGNTRFSGRPVYVASSGAYSSIENSTGLTYINLKPASGTFEKGASYYIPVPVKDSKLGTLSVTYSFDENGTITESISTGKKSNVNLALGYIYDLGTPNIVYDPNPSLTVRDILVRDLDSAEATGLTIENAYSIKNCEDKDILVTYDGTLVTSASVSGGTVTYGVSKNSTEETREGWIKLALEGTEGYTIPVTQRYEGAVINYVWDFSSADWQAEFAKFGAVNTDIENWNLTYDGLTLVSTQKSKYNTTFFQWGGKGSTSDRYLKFEAPAAGTLTVTASNTSNSEDLTRMVTVNQGGAETSLPGGAASNASASVVSFDVQAGEVLIYCTGNPLRFYKIEYTSGESGSTGGDGGGEEGDTGKEEGPKTHVYYYNKNGSEVNLSNDVGSSYFTSSQSAASLSSDYKFQEWTLEGFSSNRGLKLNSTGFLKFTTSTEYSSTVQFWFISRKAGTAQIQLIADGGGSPTILDTPYDTIGDSGTISLDKGVSYTIQQKASEQALLLVIVKETE